MMKKLLVLMLVLGLASSAGAITVDLRADDVDTLDVTLTPWNPTVEVSIYSDTAVAGHEEVVTVDTHGTAGGIGTFTAVTITAVAGQQAYVTNPYFALSWAYLVVAMDNTPGELPNITAGEHFYFDYTATVFDGSQQIIDLRVRDLDWTLIESMVITQVPEPATIALLGLGSLFLRRRRK